LRLLGRAPTWACPTVDVLIEALGIYFSMGRIEWTSSNRVWASIKTFAVFFKSLKSKLIPVRVTYFQGEKSRKTFNSVD